MARRNSMFGLSPDMPQFIEARIENIRPNPHQPRKTINDKNIERLAENIAQTGLKQPIVLVKTEDPDIYILGAGQRRLLAHQKLGRDTIPAMIAVTGSPAEIALTENLQREDLNPLDAAEAMARLMEEYGYTQEQLADFLGEQRSTVTEWLSINKLPEKIKQECRALDTVGKTHLVALARLLDRHEEMLELWEQLRAGRRISTRELQRRQRGGAAEEPELCDVPREFKPVMRIMKVTNQLHEALKKIKPATLVGHSERLDELKVLHHQIGRLIAKLAKQSKSNIVQDEDESKDMSGLPVSENVSAEDGAHAK